MPIDSLTWRSPNYAQAPKRRIDSLCLHTGEGRDAASDLGWLCNPRSKASAHFYVTRDATIFQLVDPVNVAWGAGRSNYLGRTDWNVNALHVETEHLEGQDWPYVQRAMLRDLCRSLIAMYGIPAPYVVAHRWIAIPKLPRPRRFDPSDFPDAELKAWIADLYVQLATSFDRLYRVKAGVQAVVRQDYRRAAPQVLTLPAGHVEAIDSIRFGEGGDWLHTASGAGFSAADAWERV